MTSIVNIPTGDLADELARRIRARPKDIAQAKRIASLERELAEMTRDRDSWKGTAESYANAWKRELGPYGIRNKTHLIDALVLTTRDIVAAYSGWIRETELMRERRRQEDIAKTVGWESKLPIDLEIV